MNHPDSRSRRRFIAPCVLLPLAVAAASVGAAPSSQAKRQRVLVAYFSRSGNTRVIAAQIGRSLRAVVFEIEPATPYPDDYFKTVEQARRERDSGFRPALKGRAPNLDDYGVVYLGFPIWEGTVPPIIRSFLTAHDLTGKILIPFITHGGYGIGDSQTVLAGQAEGARLREPALVMQADQERQTIERVTRWLDDIRQQQSPSK